MRYVIVDRFIATPKAARLIKKLQHYPVLSWLDQDDYDVNDVCYLDLIDGRLFSVYEDGTQIEYRPETTQLAA